jgi:hypothetical protein
MAWFLALQGPTSGTGQSQTYELQETADIERLADEMTASTASNGVVAIPAVFPNGRQRVTAYVRPVAWGSWAFYQMSEEERRQMLAANPLINAIAQAQAAKQQPAPQSFGPAVIPRLD